LLIRKHVCETCVAEVAALIAETKKKASVAA
jgi:hypothetical protein